MNTMITKISKGYQITIPASWRKILGLHIDSPIHIILNKRKKQVIIEPLDSDVTDFAELWVDADKYQNTLSIQDLKNLEETDYE